MKVNACVEGIRRKSGARSGCLGAEGEAAALLPPLTEDGAGFAMSAASSGAATLSQKAQPKTPGSAGAESRKRNERRRFMAEDKDASWA